MPPDDSSSPPDSDDFLNDLRAAKARAKAEFEQKERVRTAAATLEGCFSYAMHGLVTVDPGESKDLQEERAGRLTLRANEEFCEAWVRYRWIRSIDAVLKVVEPEVVERFEPQLPSVVRLRPEFILIAFRKVHQLYVRLMKDKSAASNVIGTLVELRKELGGDRYLIQFVFQQLARHVESTAHRMDEERKKAAASGGLQNSTSTTSPPAARIDAPNAGPVRLSAPELAHHSNVPLEPLRKALDRFRRANPDRGWDEVPNRRRKEPRYLYDLAAALPVIEKLRARIANRNRRDGLP